MNIKPASVPSATRFAFAVLTGMGIVLFSQATIAQTSETVNPLEEFQNSDNAADPFSDRSGSQKGVYELIHRAIQGNGRSVEDFSAEQRESLNDAASEFRRLQQERLKNEQPAATSTTPTPAPTEGTENSAQP